MFGADKPYTVKVIAVTGTVVCKLTGVSLNTAYQSLPYIIADAVVMGHGEPPYTEWGDESSVREALTAFFKRGPFWFDELSNEGESMLFGLKLTLSN